MIYVIYPKSNYIEEGLDKLINIYDIPNPDDPEPNNIAK